MNYDYYNCLIEFEKYFFFFYKLQSLASLQYEQKLKECSMFNHYCNYYLFARRRKYSSIPHACHYAQPCIDPFHNVDFSTKVIMQKNKERKEIHLFFLYCQTNRNAFLIRYQQKYFEKDSQQSFEECSPFSYFHPCIEMGKYKKKNICLLYVHQWTQKSCNESSYC